MRVLKWTIDFVPEKESPVVPVWIGFPNLRHYLYEKSALLTLARSIDPQSNWMRLLLMAIILPLLGYVLNLTA